ncbi:MAG: TonB family protein [Sphingomonadales bacterium]|nr:MAG: TonB family protein [Sphingomonadales bacterium]
MLRHVAILTLALPLAAQAQTAPAASDTPQSAAWTAAESNRPRVKTAPEFKYEPATDRPAEALAAGEFGEVVLVGILDVQGSLREVRIGESSKSASIDAAALAAASEMRFQPARDATGAPIAMILRVNLEYEHASFRGANAIARYRCGQAVRDYDWWARTWPGKSDRIYATPLGFSVAAGIKDFDSDWRNAIESCRTAPKALMLDKLQYGDFVKGMVGKR